MNSLSTNLQVSWALLSRDMYVLKKRLISIWIDTAVVLFLETILFGNLIPLMGLSVHTIAPLFLGCVMSQIFFKTTSKGFQTVGDLRFDRFIDYQITLPLSKKWLFLRSICSWIIEVMIGILPLLILGIIILHEPFSLYQISWIKTIVMMTLTSGLVSLVSFGCAYYYDYDWFMHNVWPRRFSILFGFCPFYFTWKTAYQFSPRVAQLLLLNPFTYCVEGLRSAALATEQFIPLWICIIMIFFIMMLLIKFLAIAIAKRLDPV